MDDSNSLYLKHYGVKGMKWGVRKARYDTPSINSARSNLRAEKEKLRNTKFGSRGAQKIRVESARNRLRGEKAKARYGSSLDKYSAKRVGELQSRYGRGAVRRLSKNTKKAKQGKFGVGSVKDQERRELIRKGAAVIVPAVTGMAVGKALSNNPQMVRKGIKAVKRGIMNAALFYANANAPKGASQAVRNLQPIAALPAATKRLRRG